ncbi:hypothetical protein J4Q44_G00377260 [Coregonus suidteri]|uniref:CARD domain-containing protein n=1 Tax=Coregonus suidteri TaxID=861788 RepID=A0AAN8KSP6_9TELE
MKRLSCVSTPSSVPHPANTSIPTGQGFINKHRMDLEMRLGLLQPILMCLHHQRVLKDQEREEVVSQPTKTKQIQTLLDMVVKKGARAQDHFYRALKEADPYLVEDLEEKTSCPEQAGV